MLEAEKNWDALTVEERDEEVKQYDQEFIADSAKPMSPEEQRLWQRIQRGKSRRGAATVSVRLPIDLVDRMARYAGEYNLSMDQFVKKSTHGALTFVE